MQIKFHSGQTDNFNNNRLKLIILLIFFMCVTDNAKLDLELLKSDKTLKTYSKTSSRSFLIKVIKKIISYNCR